MIDLEDTAVFMYKVDFQKSPSSDFIWRGTKDFSYLIKGLGHGSPVHFV